MLIDIYDMLLDIYDLNIIYYSHYQNKNPKILEECSGREKMAY